MSTDAVLLDRALRAIRGLIEIGEHRGVKPSDITLTIISDIERRYQIKIPEGDFKRVTNLESVTALLVEKLAAMYAEFFGLSKDPFSIAPDPRFLFMSEKHREALAHLLYGVQGGGGFVLLTGEIGAGKTTVCRCFLEQIPKRCNVAYIFNPKQTVTELLRSVCDEFRIPRRPEGATVKDYVDALNEFLLQTHAVGQTNVLIIDEALAVFKQYKRPEPAIYKNGNEDYKNLLKRDDVDAVVICSPWEWHSIQAIDAMSAGKIVGAEVCGAVKLQECWDVVNTSEKTKIPLMMMENVCYRRDVMAVLQMVRANTLDEAIALPSKHQYGNGVAIFTRNGRVAREFASKVNVGMVGIKVPIPVPVAYHTFGGWKRSAFGDTNQHGMEGVKFWTKVKTITQRWPDGSPDGGNAFVIPTMG